MEIQNTKSEKIFAILFLIIGAITVMEYSFIQGLFTGPLMMLLSIIIGLINTILSFVHKKYMNTLFYLLLTIALNMGYLLIIVRASKLIFQPIS